MKQNESLNNTCILFDPNNEAQQKAIIKFYNDGGWQRDENSFDKNCGQYIGVWEKDLNYWWNFDNKMRIIDLPKEYYPIDTPIVESEENIIDSNEIFFTDLLSLISIDVQNELLLQCKKAGADDYQTDLINENVVAVFELNKQKYLNLIANKIKRK